MAVALLSVKAKKLNGAAVCLLGSPQGREYDARIAFFAYHMDSRNIITPLTCNVKISLYVCFKSTCYGIEEILIQMKVHVEE